MPEGPVHLLRRLPALRGRLPFVSLGCYPTPVARLRALERAASLAPGTELWVKRDDLAGEPYGTSKVRKLEHVFAEALRHGAKRVATVGPLGSNHALATAIYAQKTGLECLLQLWPEPVTEKIRDVLRVEVALGATLELLGGEDEEALARLQDEPSARGATWFVPPAGTDAVGATGYVECALELADQVERGELPPPDDLVVAGGTGGVAAGLAVGLDLAEGPLRGLQVTAVRAVSRAVLSIPRLRMLAHRVRARLDRMLDGALESPPVRADRFRILHAQAGAGYGAPTEAAERAARLFRESEGLLLDPVYTAKAAAGLLEYASSEAARGRRILFLHTYGERDLRHLARHVDWEDVPVAFRTL